MLAQALDDALGIDDEANRVYALVAVVARLPLDERRAVLAQALDTAQEIDSGRSRAWALGRLFEHLPPEETELLAQALNAAQDIDDRDSRARVLSAMAERLPPEERRTVLTQALDAVLGIVHGDSRAWALIAVLDFDNIISFQVYNRLLIRKYHRVIAGDRARSTAEYSGNNFFLGSIFRSKTRNSPHQNYYQGQQTAHFINHKSFLLYPVKWNFNEDHKLCLYKISTCTGPKILKSLVLLAVPAAKKITHIIRLFIRIAMVFLEKVICFL